VAEIGLLVLAATPLGDPADASARLVRLLAEADVVAAEDTRRTRRLCDDLGVRPAGQVVSYYDAVERDRIPALVARLVDGATVVLVTDAGMPSVSDPGFRLVTAAVAAGIRVTVAPGPSAVLAALAVSGLAVDRFCFEGFLPRRDGERAARLAELADEQRTLVLFEAPHRLAACLAALADAFGPDRSAVVCRELTKTHEEVRRGSLGELAAWAAEGVRGEITVVIAGASVAERAQRAGVADPSSWAAAVAGQEATGLSRKAAIAAVAATAGVPRRAVYDAVVAAKPRP
jgi:16S rRNA (cytidine1402-2'-O)-methyltransferase